MAFSVTQRVISSEDMIYSYCDDFCRKAKLLYNAALFRIRNIFTGYEKEHRTDNEEDVRKYTAPDQPQLMTRIRREAMCYYNTNGFVEDPEAEHRKFKNRISWSDEEKQIFVEKYVQHPKKFGIIAAALPLKSVKDVIEFYYINRYDLCLKEKEGAFRKRGGRRKVTSEGRSSY